MDFVMHVRFVIFLLLFNRSECFLDWLFGAEIREEDKKKEGSEVGAVVNIPFELTVADEKFLAEAQEYGLQTSELDACYHKVIIKIKSCQNMNEEDIGKLSVRLLNCQSAIEGRTIFPCTDKMTLQECTKDMDSTTWNAYQIVSNRARAVCYVARQQQFSAKTEMTVNKLVSTTKYQLDAMKAIQTHQEKVSHLTQQTLSTMALGQQDLLQQQQRLKVAQNNIHNFVAGNLREILREKALIAAGQKELADMTNSIKEKLDEASNHLHKNEQERLENHQEILSDLSAIQSKAKEVWEKIENSTQKLLQQQIKTSENYKETLRNLQLINETISHMMHVVEQVRTEINLKLGWLGKLLDGTGEQLTLLNTCILHLAYFLLAAISAVFIHAPYLSRILLLFLVPLNAVLEIKNGRFLDFFSLTAIIVFTTF
ncbi:protein brambleberry-like, partial [Centruroides sculpturatus]|uniref:protein brambleberry-like n=1 Tax=Centruroides sculpturatus TaxID=218467 RepID=UPI000C6D407B